MKKIILPLFVVSFIAVSCNSNSAAADDNTATDSTATHNHNHDDSTSTLLAIPANASVSFANLKDGDTVNSPVLVEFGIEGMTVEPAGEAHEGKGHHHIIINGGFIAEGGVVPADSVNIHYGGGQTSDTLDLPAGTHTLTMQFADGYHRSYGEQLAKTISITVAEKK
jgi:hypothetical protein